MPARARQNPAYRPPGTRCPPAEEHAATRARRGVAFRPRCRLCPFFTFFAHAFPCYPIFVPHRPAGSGGRQAGAGPSGEPVGPSPCRFAPDAGGAGRRRQAAGKDDTGGNDAVPRHPPQQAGQEGPRQRARGVPCGARTPWHLREIILRPSHRSPCLDCWPEPEFARLAAGLGALSAFSEEQEDLSASLLPMRMPSAPTPRAGWCCPRS